MKIELIKAKENKDHNYKFNFEQIIKSIDKLNKLMSPLLNEEMKKNIKSIKKTELLINKTNQLVKENKIKLDELVCAKKKKGIKREIISALLYLVQNFDLSFEQLMQCKKIIGKVDKLNIDGLNKQINQLKNITQRFLHK